MTPITGAVRHTSGQTPPPAHDPSNPHPRAVTGAHSRKSQQVADDKPVQTFFTDDQDHKWQCTSELSVTHHWDGPTGQADPKNANPGTEPPETPKNSPTAQPGPKNTPPTTSTTPKKPTNQPKPHQTHQHPKNQKSNTCPP